jgi:hypothetical protein
MFLASSMDLPIVWFETLDKGRVDFRWVEFEAAFRDKFIPR